MIETFYNNDKTKSFDITIPEVNILGLWFSGGIESSLLLYLLAKLIQDNKLDIKIQPATMCLSDIDKDEKPSISKKLELSLAMIENYTTARTIAPNICNIVTEILDTNCILPLKKYFPISSVWKEYVNKERENYENKTWDVLYSGRNALPPEEVHGGKEKWPNLVKPHMINPVGHEGIFWKIRDPNVIQEEVFKFSKNIVDSDQSGTYWQLFVPFANIDKKFIANLYEQFDLLDTLLPTTKSCSFVPLEELVGCGKCFHCMEKYYGFGVY